ncbi:hemophore-related protein [Mycolicibacterium sp. BK556]|uniref:heme-binding protein n=1 Tax=unclassified Mycolicibacterium TaxID=2636767 RepID=UPI001610D339|nr:MULTISPECIES: heme-binding protein [unclassified Mycolicibacterium]MBB3601424.1 hemophore-related protein [Mycolicibacterium sp. BK556]MBB3631176.1 hemophore-related protein [Mycolicibacterium sp. BK607]MBB3749179.1 hemophore-related protein [Mycolicibacterium sp. BK634]
MTIDSRRLVATLVGFGAIAAGTFGQIPSAAADPDAPPPPPNCTAADMEGVRMGVQAATSAYLFTHPDVNAFFTSMAGVPRAQVLQRVKAYMAANPQTASDITGIRQPLVDIKNRCGQLPGSAV